MPQPDLPPLHPGDQLREEFMRPLGLSAQRLAQDLDVPVGRIQSLIEERDAISGDTALRLSRYFGTTPEFWLNLQRDYDLARALIEAGDKIRSTVRPHAV